MSLEKNIENLEKLKANLDKYIVRPANGLGIGGFVFGVERSATVNLRSDITDNYVEDNSAVQDHIALRPVTINLTNYVGELTYEEQSDTVLASLTKKLTIISDYIPDVISSAKKIKTTIETRDLSIENITDVGTDLWSLVKNLNATSTKQAQAYQYFKALWEQKILISVETPFAFFANMAIETLSAHQGEDSKDISEFSITLKQIRTTQTEIIPFDKDKWQGRTSNQRSDEVNIGKAQGKSKSLLATAYDNYKAAQ